MNRDRQGEGAVDAGASITNVTKLPDEQAASLLAMAKQRGAAARA